MALLFNQENKLDLKTSPFHQSDSGISEMSEEYDFNPGSVESAGSGGTSGSEPIMLDDLVESMEFNPFCNSKNVKNELMDYVESSSTSRLSTDSFDGADKDLQSYLERPSSRCSISTDSNGDLAELQSLIESNNDGSRPNKENRIINYHRPATRNSTRGKNGPKNTQFPKVVLRKAQVEKVNKMDSSVTVLEDATPTSGVKSIKVLKVIKAPQTCTSEETACQVVEALDDRNRKNAINAKMNRDKKKAYINGLESEISVCREENNKLKGDNKVLLSEKLALEEQVEYFKSILANQSTLSKVLNTMENLKGVRLSSSIAKGSRKRALDADHSYNAKSRKSDLKDSTASTRQSSDSAGVCLHVHEDSVSLEFCSHCSNMAKSVDS